MTGAENRLAALERTLVGAAAEQAGRLRRRRRRAVALAALAAPLALAAAGSVAATGFFAGVDRHLSSLRDERLETPPGVIAGMQGAAGARPRDAASGRTWLVAGQRVVGYTTRSGGFCFRFVELAGGCLARDTLSPARPLDVMTDNGPGEFRVYGLAADEVTAITLHARGVTRRVAMGRNAFFLDEPALGTRRSFDATLVVRLRDGTARTVPIRIGGPSPAKRLPVLPGSLPVANTAA